MKMLKPVICFFLLLGICSACLKKPNDLIGLVTVSGTVRDAVSGEPLPDVQIEMTKIENLYNGLGYVDIETDVVATAVSNAEGRYYLSYESKGVRAFMLYATPVDPLHVRYPFVQGKSDRIKKAGKHKRDLTCFRSAYAEVMLINKPPVDTVHRISLGVYASSDDIELENLVIDTTIYLKLIGSKKFSTNLRYERTGAEDTTIKLTADPWDTLPVRLYY